MDTLNKLQSDVLEKKQNWVIDQSHSKLQFAVKHMVIAEVVGNFKSFDFKIENIKEEFTESDIELTIEANSIESGVSDRDNHLRSADFFDVRKYPVIKFKSKSFKKVDDEKFRLIGDLTIKNITKQVELDVTYGGQIVDPYGKLRAGFKVVGNINRFDFDLKWNILIETGGAVVGKNVNIVCDIEIIKL